jgi:hypothetical protein
MRNQDVVIAQLKQAISKERESTLAVLHLLKEVELDRHYLATGYPSLFEFATTELGYSAGAHRRIQSMRLLKSIPAIAAQIESGGLSLCTAAKAQSFFKKEDLRRRDSGEERLSIQTKKEVVDSLIGTSIRECERKLVELSPEAALPRECARPMSSDKTLIQFVADAELMEKLERLKGLLAHRNFDGRYDMLFHSLADLALRKLDPQESASSASIDSTTDKSNSNKSNSNKSNSNKSNSNKSNSERSSEPPATSTAGNEISPDAESSKAHTGKSRYIPASIRRRVWQRDGGTCTFIDPKSGRRCGSRHALELDHIRPFAWNGPGTAENLRLYCSSHNKYSAQKLGLGSGSSRLRRTGS